LQAAMKACHCNAT